MGSHSDSGCLISVVAKFLLPMRAPDRLEIVAGIKPFRNVADALAQCLAVTQISRAREHVDLGTGVVDVILARDLEASEGKKTGQRIAEHGAAAVADMHRPGRIGRNIFDVDWHAAADVASAVVGPKPHGSAQRVDPGTRLEREIDEARARNFGLPTMRSSARSFAAIASASSRGFLPASLASTIAAFVAASPWLGSRGGSTVTRDRSMPAGNAPAANQFIDRAADAREKLGENVFCNHERAARLTQFRGRVKEPAMLGKRVAVGHAGDEIGDAARPRGVVEAGEPFCHSAGKSPRCAL